MRKGESQHYFKQTSDDSFIQMNLLLLNFDSYLMFPQKYLFIIYIFILCCFVCCVFKILLFVLLRFVILSLSSSICRSCKSVFEQLNLDLRRYIMFYIIFIIIFTTTPTIITTIIIQMKKMNFYKRKTVIM